MATSRTSYGGAWTGWIIFAAAMLLMVGTFNIIEGIVALVDDKRLVLVADKLIAVDVTGWGWTILIFGALMVATGLGLFSAQTWARITGIIVVGLHFVVQVGWLGAYPVWSVLMLVLDTVIIFALTARWGAATGPDYGYSSRDQVGQHASAR
jgi:hypothetical protein